jgi:hypothetical protein
MKETRTNDLIALAQAGHLIIGERTVETHVSELLSKMGLASRGLTTQIISPGCPLVCPVASWRTRERR